jgi:nucleotide-binding universal stress UspA family protein
MTDNLFRRIVLPVASEEDARTTCEQVRPRLPDGGEVLAVHVIEKAGGTPDKASIEQREGLARAIFAAVEEELSAASVDLETEILYGTDVAEAIFDAADEFDATAVVFTPRGGSRWLKLLTGDTATNLIETADRPVVVLPDAAHRPGDDPADPGGELSNADGESDQPDAGTSDGECDG